MKKYKYNFILIFMLLFFIIFVSSCNYANKKEETKEDDKKEDIFKPSDYKDEAGYIRDKEGIYSENIILNKTNYEKYKNELIGDSGQSGLINKNLLNLDKKINESDYNYFICYFYAYWKGSLNLKNYFKVNLINENEVLFDADAILVDELIINNYKIENKENYNPNVSFDFSKDPFERLSIKVYGSILLKDYNNTFFTIVMPFKIKEKGNLNIDFSINEDKLDYSYHKENNIIIGDYSDENSNLRINDYKISFKS